jgi:dolichyl-phosphate beta-glucosyltransferase
MLAGAGLALWLFLAHLTNATLFQLAPDRALPGLIMLAVLPLLLNGFRRKVFFGTKLSLHQGISFEFIFQLVRWISPLLPSRRFQTAFQMRETGQDRALASSWQDIQAASFPASAMLATTLWLSVDGHTLAAVVALIVGIGTLLWGHKTLKQRTVKPRGYLATCFTTVFLWAVEAMVFAWASNGMLPTNAAMGLWLAVALVTHRPGLPLGLGIVQLPALLLFTSGLSDTAMLLLSTFMFCRLTTLAGLGLLYLSRYKLRVSDLFQHTIVSRILGSQRPRGGWPATPEVERAPLKLSIVIPAYQEEQRLPRYLGEVQRHLADKRYLWEIIVVDDGSTDNTMNIVLAEQAKDSHIKAIRLEQNSGKGSAVMRGIQEARGRYIIFSDADGSTPAQEIDKLLPVLESGSEVAVGSRILKAPELERNRRALRQLLGMVFYRLVNFFAVPGVGDTQCGFKGFRQDVARHLFNNLTEQGWAFDVEVLYRAQLLGYAITEVPIQWHEVAGSKLRPLRDSARMAFAILRIRQHNTGFFKRNSEESGAREASLALE